MKNLDTKKENHGLLGSKHGVVPRDTLAPWSKGLSAVG